MNDGGPAFPRPLSYIRQGDWCSESSSEQDGMSLRDYFATHAPSPPEWWMDKKPNIAGYSNPVLERSIREDEDKRKQWEGWGDWLEDSDIKPEWLAEFKADVAARDEHSRRYDEKLNAFLIERETKWRYHYADAMLAAREQKGT